MSAEPQTKNALELPDLHESLLDAPTVAQLFRDVAEHAQLIEIALKGGAEARCQEQGIDLSSAHQQLCAGQVRGVQLRYRYQGKEWWDTLIQTGMGVRLVRIAHEWR